MIEKIKGVCKLIIEMGLYLISISILVEVVFGTTAPFLSLGVVSKITQMIASLGSAGLVGLLASGVIIYLFTKKK